ncbi:MAG: hypothetical protein ACFFA5_10975 [Promethearchaeota archaeon]
MQNVTKEIFLNALVCPTLGWLMRTDQISLKQTFSKIMEEEMSIGRRVRELYPEGILVDDENIESALQKTRSLMDDPRISILFEATFLINRFVTRADILKRKNKDWHLIEVKSSVIDKKDFIDDMAYTAMVMEYPNFHGSTSVKNVLPALVPGMSYDSLEIAHGDSAMLSFAFLALNKYEDKDIEKVRRNLLAYCEQDTIAMVKLHKYLLDYV